MSVCVGGEKRMYIALHIVRSEKREGHIGWHGKGCQKYEKKQ